MMRVNFICMRDKSYILSKPSLPSLENNGWFLEGTDYLISKMWLPNTLSRKLLICQEQHCTPLCKCGRNNHSESKIQDNDHENDDDVDDLFV